MHGKGTLITLIACLILEAVGLQSQVLPFDLDVGIYRAAGNRSRLEVYLEINRGQVTYEEVRGRYVAHLAGVVLINQRGRIVDFREMSIDDIVERLNGAPQGTIPKQATFTLAPGEYEVQVAVEDDQGNRADSSFKIELPAHRDYVLGTSTIQLGRLIRRASREKEFFKQGLTVWPRAGAVYSRIQPLLWYYVEVYGLTPLDTVETQAVVWQDSSEAITLGPKRTPSPALVYKDWGAINLSDFTAGDYQLSFIVAVDGDTATAKKTFKVVGEELIPSDTGDVLVALSSARLFDFASGMSMIQPELDLQQYRSGDLANRHRMIRVAVGRLAREFNRDSTTYLAELLQRWPQVKAYDPGWRARGRLSEQGRTIFLHGLPTTIETYPASSALREHHIWTFVYPDSTHQFVFVDRKGYGEFALVHATKPGVVWNENWRRELPWVPVTPAAAPEAEVVEPAAVETVAPEPVIIDTLAAPALELEAEVAEPAVVETVE
ncbi:MAG: hypothetical protein ACETWG_03340, partial [Candidatus Neomarinimicrobiota bacterium]